MSIALQVGEFPQLTSKLSFGLLSGPKWVSTARHDVSYALCAAEPEMRICTRRLDPRSLAKRLKRGLAKDGPVEKRYTRGRTKPAQARFSVKAAADRNQSLTESTFRSTGLAHAAQESGSTLHATHRRKIWAMHFGGQCGTAGSAEQAEMPNRQQWQADKTRTRLGCPKMSGHHAKRPPRCWTY